MCVNISNTLYLNGIDVQLCSTHSGGSLRKDMDPGIVFHCLNKKSGTDLKAFFKLIKIIKDEKINLVHAHSTSVFWAVAAKAFKRNLKIIWHDHLGSRADNKKQNFIYKIISHKIDGIIAASSEIESWSVNNMRVSRDRIVYLNNYSLIKVEKRKIDPHFFTIVCVANILPVKNHELIIKALTLLNADVDSLQFQVIFAGAFSENDYFINLKQLIAQLRLDSIIKFAGKVDDISGLLAMADCGILASLSEGLPVSLLEYGMASLPVIVTDVGQCSEIVKNGELGIVIKPDDPEAMAKALLWVIKNSDEARLMGQAFGEHVNKNYGQDKFLSGYMDLLKSVFKHV